MFSQGEKKTTACVSALIFGFVGAVMITSQGMAMEQNSSIRILEELNSYARSQSEKRNICIDFTVKCGIFFENNQFDEANNAQSIIQGFDLKSPHDLDVLYTLITLTVGEPMSQRIQFILDYQKPKGL